jgi:RNA polymerase sigma-70 factor (ECF subfamily)
MDEPKYLVGEADLVTAAREDEQAFVALYDFYFPRLYAFVARRVGNREEAEDIVSEVFMRATVALPGFRAGTKFGGWLYRVATNLVIDRARRYRRERTAEEGETEAVPDRGPQPDEAVQQLLDRSVLERILAGLPVRDREVLHLKYFADLDNQELAAALGVTPNHAGVLLHRAVQRASKLAQKYVC